MIAVSPSPSPLRAPSIEQELAATLAGFKHRPLDFAIWAFPWGEEQTELEGRWLEQWQLDLLRDVQEGLLSAEVALKIAMKSGHDVGKSALICILSLWAFTTCVGCRGRMTANTERQLRTTLWVELGKWFQLFIAKQFFEYTATKLTSRDPNAPENWRIDAMPWSDINPTAFAGLHNYGNRIIVIFDEAEGIPDIIWEVIDGVMREADTELIWLASSQPRRNQGRFYECWNKFADQWKQYTIDSREVRMANQAAIAADIKAYGGEDDDTTRIRIRGEFPLVSTFQLIPQELIAKARKGEVQSQHWEPLILGVDVARYGNNESVAVFRRGRDARTIPTERWHFSPTANPTVETANRVAHMIATHKPDQVFVDEGGYGGGVIDFLRHLGHTVIGVNFGVPPSTKPSGIIVANKRAEMYISTREWLREGGCIQDSQDLETQLLSITYKYQERTGALLLLSKEEMRARGIASPDIADALVMTFAYPVSLRTARSKGAVKVEYDPLDWSALPSQGELTRAGGWQ